MPLLLSRPTALFMLHITPILAVAASTLALSCVLAAVCLTLCLLGRAGGFLAAVAVPAEGAASPPTAAPPTAQIVNMNPA
jgi:hypothetical protein